MYFVNLQLVCRYSERIRLHHIRRTKMLRIVCWDSISLKLISVAAHSARRSDPPCLPGHRSLIFLIVFTSPDVSQRFPKALSVISTFRCTTTFSQAHAYRKSRLVSNKPPFQRKTDGMKCIMAQSTQVYARSCISFLRA